MPELTVDGDDETVLRIHLCARDSLVVTGHEWAVELARAGYAVQESDGGWVGGGPIAVRFRTARIVGDLYANMGPDGCRDYVVRIQFASAAGRRMSWRTVFSDRPASKQFGRCIRLFSPDERFPFSIDDYSFGVCPPEP